MAADTKPKKLLKTALGLTLSPVFLFRADEVLK